MGCDIHMFAEHKKDGKWQKVGKVFKNSYYKPDSEYEWEEDEYTDEPYDDRNYKLFGFLANVRNGYGFAGVDTGDAIKPIALPRGVPDDASAEWKIEVEEWGIDMHSHSYFTVRELLDADWNQPLTARGVVNVDEYKKLKESEQFPTSYSGWIEGPEIKVASQEDYDNGLAPDATHIQMEWSEPIKDFAGRFYTETLPQLEALGDPDEIRIVFGFDN